MAAKNTTYIEPPKKVKWFPGKPPAIGWWPSTHVTTQKSGSVALLRYFDGVSWSIPIGSHYTALDVLDYVTTNPDGRLHEACVSSFSNWALVWAEKWWEEA